MKLVIEMSGTSERLYTTYLFIWGISLSSVFKLAGMCLDLKYKKLRNKKMKIDVFSIIE